MALTPRTLWGRLEFSVLMAGIVTAGCLWGFFELMEFASSTTPHGFDTRILLAFREPGDPKNPIGPFWLEEAMRDVTALGSASVLIMLTASVVFYLLLSRRAGMALFVLLTIAGGQVMSSLLKFGIDRPRPGLVPHLADVYTTSFPSGHAMMSAVTYLTLGVLLAAVQTERRMKIYVLSMAILATTLVGVSRIYLGVHWPSDVLAGWCAGAAWALLCWLVARWLRRSESPAG
jgi:undecaprenyl-diphosphatase